MGLTQAVDMAGHVSDVLRILQVMLATEIRQPQVPAIVMSLVDKRCDDDGEMLSGIGRVAAFLDASALDDTVSVGMRVRTDKIRISAAIAVVMDRGEIHVLCVTCTVQSRIENSYAGYRRLPRHRGTYHRMSAATAVIHR